MAQATMINPTTGEKRVVESGSSQASSLFGQGFFLMGADGKAVGAPAAAPTAPTTTPTAAPAAPVPTAPTVRASSPVPTGQKATLYGPSGEREVVDVGSDRAKQLQSRGFSLTLGDAQSKPKATLYGPNGERRVVFVGSSEASSLQSQGYTLTDTKARTTSQGLRTDQSNQTMDQFLADQQKRKEIESAKLDAELADIKNRLNPGGAPTAPKFGEEFNRLRTERGVPGLEQDVQNLDKQLADLDASFTQGQENVRNKLAPMEVLAGEHRELQFQYQQKRDAIVREQAVKINALNSANNIIGMQMQFSQQDFTNAMATYDAEYRRNLDAIQLFQQEREYKDNIERQERQDAQANLTTMSNLITASGKSWQDLSPAMRSTITRLELQAGFPAGLFQQFAIAKPKAKLLSTVDGYDSAGNGIITMIYEDENGLPGMVRTIKTGTRRAESGSGSSKTLLDQLKEDFEEGMSYATAQQLYPEFKGSTIDTIYGKDADDVPLFGGTTTPTKSTETISQGTSKPWWQFWK